MCKIIFVFCCLLALNSGGFAQIPEAIAIDSIFADWDHPDVPGGSVGVMRNGELIFSKGYGMANLDYDIPNSPTTSFEIGSTSKQFTAACIILLIQRDSLSFESTLHEFFPQFPDYAKKITVRHLLNHMSGVRDYIYLFVHKGIWVDGDYTDEDIMNMLARQESINFEPGEICSYSNSGYWLLGKIVEKVSRKKLDEFARDEIFIPLGMNDTRFNNVSNAVIKNRAIAYVKNEDGEYGTMLHRQNAAGAAGIYTTIEDMKKWDDAFYDSPILNKEFWQMMTSPGMLNNGKTTMHTPDLAFASGLIVGKYKGLKIVSHPGSMAGYRAQMLRFPDQHLTIVAFSNYASGDPVGKCNKVADLLLSDFFGKQPKADIVDKPTIKLEPKELEKFVGDFWIEEEYRFRTIYLKDDTLRWIGSSADWNLIPIDKNEFKFEDDTELIIFSLNAEGNMTYTHSSVDQQNPWTISGTRLDPSNFTTNQLKEFVGTYYSEELQHEYEVKLIDNQIIVFSNKNYSGVAEAISGDWFREGGRNLTFARNKKGEVIGINLRDASGLSDIYFVKIRCN